MSVCKPLAVALCPVQPTSSGSYLGQAELQAAVGLAGSGGGGRGHPCLWEWLMHGDILGHQLVIHVCHLHHQVNMRVNETARSRSPEPRAQSGCWMSFGWHGAPVEAWMLNDETFESSEFLVFFRRQYGSPHFVAEAGCKGWNHSRCLLPW